MPTDPRGLRGDAPLLDAWLRFHEQPPTPFTIPGHKQRHDLVGDVVAGDVPLYAGLDTMKLATGVLAEAEARAARLWGADVCRFSVGGATHANQALALALGGDGDRVVVSRTLHRSLLLGLVLAGLEPVWVQPDVDPATGLPLGVPPAAVPRALAAHPDARAVLVGDPSYVGTVGDVAGLAEVAHAHDVPLVVDAAWAAHFGFHPDLPAHALALGADAMVVSAHKTLPAWSQAALVLARTERIDPARLDAGVEATATTSPAGAILASTDAARALLERDGEALLGPVIAAVADGPGAAAGGRRPRRPRRRRRRPAEAHPRAVRHRRRRRRRRARPARRGAAGRGRRARRPRRRGVARRHRGDRWTPSPTPSSPRWTGTAGRPGRSWARAVYRVEPVTGAAAAHRVLRRPRGGADRRRPSAGSAPSWSRPTRRASRCSRRASRSPTACSPRCARPGRRRPDRLRRRPHAGHAPGGALTCSRRRLADVVAERPVVLDGGLATLLEARGHDLSSALWSARLLRDDPEAIVAAHPSSSRRAPRWRSRRPTRCRSANLGDEAPALLRDSVRLAARARDEAAPDGWVAASVGPYGALLADGSEYTGDYDLDVAGLRAFHRPRLDVLREAGADVLAVETVPCLAEVEAVLAELDGTGHPAWLSLSAAGSAPAPASRWPRRSRWPPTCAEVIARRRQLHGTGRRAGGGRAAARGAAGGRLPEQRRRAGTPCAGPGPASRRSTPPTSRPGSPPAPGSSAAAAGSGRTTSGSSPSGWGETDPMAFHGVPSGAYERFMGRFSTPLAPVFADAALAGAADHPDVIDVGCGPGMLTAELAGAPTRPGSPPLTRPPPFLAATAVRFPRADVREASAEALPFADDTFDAALAQLVVHFMQDPAGRAAGDGPRHPARRRGGRLRAGRRRRHRPAVDVLGDGAPPSTRTGAGERSRWDADRLAGLLREVGLRDVSHELLTVTVGFDGFDDWWGPFTESVGPAGDYVAGLDPDRRERLESALRDQLGADPFEMTVGAWSAVGRVGS